MAYIIAAKGEKTIISHQGKMGNCGHWSKAHTGVHDQYKFYTGENFAKGRMEKHFQRGMACKPRLFLRSQYAWSQLDRNEEKV